MIIISQHIINTDQIKEKAPHLKAGDSVLLSGVVYTARDAAHKRIWEILHKGGKPPIDLSQAVIYYAGPTPTPEGMAIGSCGPTTSCRMDSYTPNFMDQGLICTIGKGERSQEVYDAIVRNDGVYLCALGGAGALAAGCVQSSEVVAFEELGCESIKRLVIIDFPLIVGADCKGNVIFAK